MLSESAKIHVARFVTGAEKTVKNQNAKTKPPREKKKNTVFPPKTVDESCFVRETAAEGKVYELGLKGKTVLTTASRKDSLTR